MAFKIFGLCLSSFIAIVIAVIFMVMYFMEHREKEHWRSQAERMSEYSTWQAEKIDELEELNRELLIGSD